MKRQQLPYDPDPLTVEPDLEPVRRRAPTDGDPLGLFAIFLAILVVLAIIGLASIIDVRG